MIVLILILLIIIVSIFPWIFIKKFKNNIMSWKIYEYKEFNNIQNYIEIVKDELNSFEKFIMFGITGLIALFIALKVTTTLSLLFQIFSGLIIIFLISTYLVIIKLGRSIMKNLYIIKDNL